MSRAWTALVVSVMVLAGCRTYGGYGTEVETYNQIERVLTQAQAEIARARADFGVLDRLAQEGGDPYLTALAAQYGALVEGHAALLDEHMDLAEELSPQSSYRSLHRAYGAIVTEQILALEQYQGLLRYVYDAYTADTTVTAKEGLPYYVAPPYYDRVTSQARELTVNEVVERIQSGAAPRMGFRLLVPEMPRVVEATGHGAEGAH